MVVEIFSFFKNHDSGFFFFRLVITRIHIHTHWLMTINHHHSLNLFFHPFSTFYILISWIFFLFLTIMQNRGKWKLSNLLINQVKRTRFSFLFYTSNLQKFFMIFWLFFCFSKFFFPLSNSIDLCVCVCGINLHGIYLFCKILDFFFFSLSSHASPFFYK